MRSLLAAFQHKVFLLTAFSWGWFEVEFIPKPMRVFFLGASMAIDLATGLIKSWKAGVATSSAGFQRTIIKLTRYCSVIIATWFMANVLSSMSPGKPIDYSFLVNGAIAFLTFVEIYSIFENVYEIDPEGPLSKWLVGPTLKFLRGKLKNNPMNQLTETELENENESDRK